jgi:hypothetical protein
MADDPRRNDAKGKGFTVGKYLRKRVRDHT